MKVEVDERGFLVLKQVYNSVVLETGEGNQYAVCMRDDTIEVLVLNGPDPRVFTGAEATSWPTTPTPTGSPTSA